MRSHFAFVSRSLNVYNSNYLSSLIDDRAQVPLKRHLFSSDVAVQTDSVMVGATTPLIIDEDIFPQAKISASEEDVINKLTAADLASILKWSREISRDINLSLALQRLTEIATGECRFVVSLS